MWRNSAQQKAVRSDEEAIDGVGGNDQHVREFNSKYSGTRSSASTLPMCMVDWWRHFWGMGGRSWGRWLPSSRQSGPGSAEGSPLQSWTVACKKNKPQNFNSCAIEMFWNNNLPVDWNLLIYTFLGQWKSKGRHHTQHIRADCILHYNALYTYL